MVEPVCVVTGVGPGTGSALARRFAKGGYRVALLARDRQRLAALEQELPGAKAYPCDVSDAQQVDKTAELIERDLGQPSVLVHNAVAGAFGSFLEIDPQVLNRNFQVNAMGLLYLARRFAPAMVQAGKGAILVTGNTSALRGKPFFAGFAHPRRGAGARARAQGRACRLSRDRCGDRRAMGPRALQAEAGRVLHQAGSHRRRVVARGAPGPLGMVVQCRSAALRGELVGLGWRGDAAWRGDSTLLASQPGDALPLVF